MREQPQSARLTQRERDVLILLASGRSNKEIAETLGLTPGTVKGYVSLIFEKLKVTNRTQATLAALGMGLTPSLNTQDL
ncbi:MAG: response regulator transcription factor [Armatimonas sp.]